MPENTEETPTLYRVEFERIGRNHHVEPTTYLAKDVDDLAEQLWKASRGHLGSRDYMVGVDLEAGTVFIGGGRLGKGTVTAVTS